MHVAVLIIDSDDGVVNAFVKTLGRHNFIVYVASSTSQALYTLKKRKVHAVIADIRVPGPPGIDLLRTIKALYPSLPVIVVTAYSTSFTEPDAVREGADGYFVKPFDLNALIQKLKAVIESPNQLAMPAG
jgi:DNA-binding NtrC family response regulator